MTTMRPNRRFNEIAKTIGKGLSDARNAGVTSDEAVRKLVEAMISTAALASLIKPVHEAYELAEWANEEIQEEIYGCMACKADGIPVHWSHADSFGLDLLRASVDLAMAELIARRIGFSVDLDYCTFDILVGPSNCECEEPCYEAFDVLDTKELISFLRDCEKLALADCDCDNGPH